MCRSYDRVSEGDLSGECLVGVRLATARAEVVCDVSCLGAGCRLCGGEADGVAVALKSYLLFLSALALIDVNALGLVESGLAPLVRRLSLYCAAAEISLLVLFRTRGNELCSVGGVSVGIELAVGLAADVTVCLGYAGDDAAAVRKLRALV